LCATQAGSQCRFGSDQRPFVLVNGLSRGDQLHADPIDFHVANTADLYAAGGYLKKLLVLSEVFFIE
jgi:hypothetical protein